jgi:LmbE family N-acetylglucosaminyl deacetylase
MRILVVVAHPDDEVLGCGATIARFTQEGHEVFIAILGEGITSRYQRREQADPSLIKTLHATSRQVAQLLGVEDLFFYSLPDNRFDTLPLLDLVKIIEELIARLEPEVIYTHHGGDLNIDHMVTHRAVLTATRPVGGCPVRELYAFEVPSSTEWTFGQLQPSFRPNVFMDISDTLEAKMQAMALYESEVRPFPHPSSPDAIRAIARRWGSTAGVEAAEAFELVRATR